MSVDSLLKFHEVPEALAHRRRIAEAQRHAPPAAAFGGGAQRRRERGHRRQPIGQDDSKKGLRGYDAGKKIKGRKRHLMVDTLGLVLTVLVHSAGIQNRDGAKLLIEQLKCRQPRLRVEFAHGGYA